MASKISLNLLALTGFGNEALKGILGHEGIRIRALYTRAEKGPFPYYEEENVADLARRHGICVHLVPTAGDWDIHDSVDINLATTFHRILNETHLARARYNINVHPSLLPSYKGPTPTNWMIANKERICGLSAHFMGKGVDTGPLIYQRAYPLDAATDPQLRKFLAGKTAEAVAAILSDFPSYREIKSHYPESHYPRFLQPGLRPKAGGQGA